MGDSGASSSFRAKVLARTTGPPCSNIVSFCIEGITDATYCAYALSDGAILVQQSLRPEPATGAPDAASALHARAGLGGCFLPVLLVTRPSLEYGDEPFERLCWGGGPEALLAAATKQHVYIFALQPFFRGAAQQLPRTMPPGSADGTATIPAPSSAFTLAAVYRTATPPLAIDFTQDARGLLLTDSGGSVGMLQLIPKDVSTHSYYSTGRDSAASGSTIAFSVQEVWRVKVDSPHALAAASATCFSPCATTAAVGWGHEAGIAQPGGAQQQRITVWWPPSQQALNAAQGSHPAVGAEVVRHPVKLLSMQWSPPLLGPRAGAGASGVALKAQTADESPAPPGPSAGASGGAAGAAAAAASAPPPPVTSPALMTLGADFVIRIFVEVVMRNMLPAELAGQMPADVSMSQFLLTLVIEPPSLNLLPSSRPGLRACWARPLAVGPHGGAPQLLPSAASAPAALTGDAADAGGGGGTDGQWPAALATGSRVQWIVASAALSAPDQDDTPYEFSGMSPAAPLEEVVCVWAVDGLAAVVLSGMPGGSVSSSKAASPKAVLWGREHRAMSWLQPGKLLPPMPLQRPEDYGLSAYVMYPAGMPLLLAADSCVGMHGAYAEARSYQVTPVVEAPGGGTSQAKTRLEVTAPCRQAITGSPETIAMLLVHPAADVALLRDRTGGVALWSATPMAELPISVEPAAASALRALVAAAGQLSAVTWLSHTLPLPALLGPAAAPQPQQQSRDSSDVALPHGRYRKLAYLACVHGNRLLVYAVSVPALAGATAARRGVGGSKPASGAPDSDPWVATFVQEVCSTVLPPGIVRVQALLQGRYSARGGQVTLVALAHRQAGSRGASPGCSGGGAIPAPGHEVGQGHPQLIQHHQQVWISWRLRFGAPGGHWNAQPLELVEVLEQDILHALACHDDGRENAGDAPTYAPIACCSADAAAMLQPANGANDGDVYGADSGRSDDSATGLVVPAVACGTVDGGMQLWRCNEGGAMQLLQAERCMQLGQQALPPLAVSGMVVAVAVDEVGGYVGAAVTGGPDEQEEALYIWRIERYSSTADGGDRASSFCQLEAVVPVKDTVSSLAWLTAGGMCACLAVGYACGHISVMCRDRDGAWLELAAHTGCCAAVVGFGALHSGGIVAAAGNHLLCLSNTLDALDPMQRQQPTLAAVALDLCGPLPPYHPGPLHAMLAKGKLGPACRVLRALLAWLRTHRKGGADPASGQPSALVVDLLELLQDGLTSCRGLAAFRQLLDAPLLAAAPPPVPAPAAPATQRAAALADPSMPLRPLPGALGASAMAAPLPASGGGGRSSAALASGMLDMSAFGAMGDFDAPAPAAPTPFPAPAAPAARRPAAALESGMLDMPDMSAFGGMLGGLQPPQEEEEELLKQQQQLSSHPNASGPAAARPLDTGMLDMGAFGGMPGALEPVQPAPVRPPAASALDTGMLDMSAFGGMLGDLHPPPQEEEEEQQPQQPAPATSTQPVVKPAGSGALETGALDMSALDMSAFGGMFAGVGAPPPPPPPPPAPAPPPPAPSPPTAGGAAAPTQPPHALETGMIDMSAFGGMMGDWMPPASEDDTPRAAAATTAASQQPQPQPDEQLASMLTFSPTPSARHDASAGLPAPAAAPSVGSGQLDPTAFGMSLLPEEAAAPSGAPQLPSTSSVSFFPQQRTPSSGASSLLFTPAGSMALVPSGSASGQPQPPAPGDSPHAGGRQPPPTPQQPPAQAQEPMVQFPRVPEPSTPTCQELPELLLTYEELADLHRLLGQDMPHHLAAPAGAGAAGIPSSGPGPHAAAGSSRFYTERTSTSGAESGPGGGDEEQAQDVVSALTALGLTPEDGAELCALASALTRKSVLELAANADGGGGSISSGGGGGSTDVMVGLDFAARSFLVQARLAAAGAHAEAAAASGDEEDHAFAAAVARLFRPVSVSRSAPSDPPSTSNSIKGGLAGSGASSHGLALAAAGGARGGGGGSRMPPSPSGSWRISGSGALGGGRMASVSGGRPGAGGGGGLARSRSMKSTLSVLSFSSLPDAMAADRAGGGHVAHRDVSPAETWWQLCGLLPGLEMRACLSALFSGCQGQLLEALLPAVPWHASDEQLNEGPGSLGSTFGASASTTTRPSISWALMRKVGAGFWLADPRVTKEQAEALAKAQFGRRKEPYDCALLYMALGRKALLASLFRQAGNTKVADFLLKDFSHEEARRSAAKNAFALLGQHRYELAASFFVLARQPDDAVSVVAKERRDPQLALLLARLLDGAPGGPLACRLIDKELLPLAEASHDCSAVAALHWLAGRPKEAVMLMLATSSPARPPAPPADPPSRTSRSGAAAAAAPSLRVDAAALDFCLTLGVQALSGKPVPQGLLATLQALAQTTSLLLEQAGLHIAALEALLVALACAGHAGSGASAADVLRYSRLLAACLSYSLDAVQALVQLQPGNGAAAAGLSPTAASSRQLPGAASQALDAAAAAAACEAAAASKWHGEVCDMLSRLDAQLHMSVDRPTVLRLLGRHVRALQRAQEHPLLPPHYLGSLPALAAGEGSGHHASSHDPHRPHAQGQQQQGPGRPPVHPGPPGTLLGLQGSAFGGPAAAAVAPLHGAAPHHGGQLHGMALPVLASPEGSLRAGETASSPSSVRPLSRTASSAGGPASPAAAPAAAGQPGGGGVRDGKKKQEPAKRPDVLEAAWDVLAVDGERFRSLALMRSSHHAAAAPDQDGRLPFAVAAAKNGLMSGLLGPPALVPPAASVGPAASGPSSLFMGLMQSVLHHVRWTPDPWAIMTNESTVATADGTPTFTVPLPSMPSPGSASGPSFGGPGHGSQGLAGHQPPAPQQHQQQASQREGSGRGHAFSGAYGTAPTTCAYAMAAHPQHDTFLTGSSSPALYQWRFGETASSQAVYVPSLEPHGGGRVRSGGGSAPDVQASVPHWRHATSLAYSATGARFAGIGDGGLVALWRADVLGAGGVGYADWLHHCVGKHGNCIAFVGDSGSQVLVAGQGERGGLVGWWDSLAPWGSACVAEIRGRKAVPNALALLRPDAGGILVYGDEAGEVSATDLRMMGSQQHIWQLPRVHAGPVTSMAQWGSNTGGHIHITAPNGSTRLVQLCNLVASGSKDGGIALIDISSGQVIASVDKAHAQQRSGLPGLLGGGGSGKVVDRSIARRQRPPTAAGVAVTGLAACDGGLLSCGADGAVRYHPLNQQIMQQD